MTWGEAGHPLAALIAGVVGALLGWFVPHLIALLPEPEPEPEPDAAGTEDGPGAAPEPPGDAEPAAPKVLYRELAAGSRVAPGCALASALAAAVVGASVGPEWSLVFLVPLVPVCVALAYIDARTRLLPTRMVLPAHAVAIVVATAVAFATDDTDALVRALIGMLVVRSIFWVLWWFRSSGMGFGDVRLSALLSFALGYLGWAELVIGIYAGFVVFVVPGLVVAVARRKKAFLKTRLPFGPAMILGALLGLALGPWIAAGLGY